MLALLFAIFINGFTDAPNAIVNCVATGALPLKKAAFWAALCNLAGAAAAFKITKSVAYTVSGLVRFQGGPNFEKLSSQAVTAALLAVVLWALAAWKYGIPTSESHALMAGLAGAAFAMGGAVYDRGGWLKLFAGLAFSVSGGYLLGLFTGGALKKRKFKEKTYRKSQIAAAAATAFMHGAQDGQKFIGVYILLSHGGSPGYFPWICGAVMALGTRFGGRRIIEKVGVKMVSLQSYQGVAADIASALCLAALTVAGVPVSTTHTKTAAIMGGGHEGIDKKIARDIGIAWLATFPACALLGYLFARLIKIF